MQSHNLIFLRFLFFSKNEISLILVLLASKYSNLSKLDKGEKSVTREQFISKYLILLFIKIDISEKYVSPTFKCSNLTKLDKGEKSLIL